MAAWYGYRNLVLGAWGCGAFGHDTETVAGYFYKLFFEGKKILLCKKENKIGRQDENDIWIPFEEISERHAILYIGRMGVQIMDINSMGGTFLNGKKLIPNKRMDCKAEDILTFSNLSFRLLEKTD